jgi:alpha-1,2-mannosyltransferase
VSWLHHFVWIVPLALCLLDLRRRRVPVAPDWFLVLGWIFIGWVLVSPYRVLPNGGDLELLWTPDQHVLASVTAVLGVALLVGAIVLARRSAVRSEPVPVAASAPPGSPLPGS